MKIRTILFRSYFIIITTFIAILALIFLPFSVKWVRKTAKLWSDLTQFGLRYICGITFEVRGIEHLPKDKPVILASKHQSAFETAGLFSRFLPYPVYVFKADLDKIPFWRIITQKAGALSVKRSEGAKALKKMMEEAKVFINDGRSLVIFPEGTRTKPGIEGRYHAGVYALAKTFEDRVDVIPAALNSGKFWSKGVVMQPGVIVLEIMPALEKGLSKSEFMATLKEVIESKTRKLEAESE